MPSLDLHDLAVLINWERCTQEPRFRGTKLKELVFDERFKTIALSGEASQDPMGAVPPSRGMFWDAQGVRMGAGELDTPENMMHPRWSESPLGEREQETLFYESRSHDSCYRVSERSL